MLSPPSPRHYSIPIALLLLFSLYYALYNHLYASPPKQAQPANNVQPSINVQTSHDGFWPNFFRLLTEASPRCALPHKAIETPINGFANISPGFAYRPDLIDMVEEDVDELRTAHSWFRRLRSTASRGQTIIQAHPVSSLRLVENSCPSSLFAYGCYIGPAQSSRWMYTWSPPPSMKLMSARLSFLP